MMDSIRPLSWSISTTCLVWSDGDGAEAGFGSRDGEAVEAEEAARERRKVLEEEEVESRKVLEGLGEEKKRVREAANAMATAAMLWEDLWFGDGAL